MTITSKMRTPDERNPPSFGLDKLLFAILLTVLFFLLGQSMVRHGFHGGGRNYGDRLSEHH
jgi:hypothetical protein